MKRIFYIINSTSLIVRTDLITTLKSTSINKPPLYNIILLYFSCRALIPSFLGRKNLVSYKVKVFHSIVLE